MQKSRTQFGRILEERKIKLHEAAELIGISINSVKQLCYLTPDIKVVKVETLLKICIGLNIKAVDLFPDDEKSLALRLSRKSRKKKGD